LEVVDAFIQKKKKEWRGYRREDWQPTTAVYHYGICLI
jgi:hypothetical protein